MNASVRLSAVLAFLVAYAAYASSLEDGLVAYWAFDEGTGDVASDLSGNGNHGTIHDGTWVDGVSGSGLDLTGGYVNAGTGIPSFAGTAPYSIVAWVKGDAPQGWLVTRTNMGPPPYEVEFGLNVGGELYFFRNAPPGMNSYVECNMGIEPGMWRLVAAVYNGLDMSLYVDGNFEAFSDSVAGGGAPDIAVILGGFHFYGTPVAALDGQVDEVRIYDRALSDTEIELLYQYADGAANALSIAGTVRFMADDGHEYPAKHVKVSVYDDNPFPFSDEHIVTGHTDDNGSFNFDRDSNGNPILNEDSMPWGGGRDIYVKIIAENDAAFVTPDPLSGAYNHTTETIPDVPGGTVNVGTVILLGENSGAFGFLEAARIARGRVQEITSLTPSQKRIEYPADSPSYDDLVNRIYMDAFSAYGPFDPKRMRHLWHEYGHAVHDEIDPAVGLPGSYGSQTGWDTETDEGTALSEGWAEFFVVIVDRDPDGDVTNGLDSPHNKIEEGADWHSKDPNKIEGCAASILWDLYDVANDDAIDANWTEIWAIMSQDHPVRMYSPTDNDDFYHDWTTRCGETRAFQEIYIDHGFPVADDDREDNDANDQASDLGALGTGEHAWADLICVDQDWYVFSMSTAAGAGDRASITFSQTRGDLDLYVYDSSDQLVGQSEGESDTETVSLPEGLPAGTYYIQVVGKGGDYSPNYTLRVSLSSPTSLPPTNLDLPTAYDTGKYDNDDITSSTAPHITGHAVPASTVRLYVGPPGSYVLVGTGAADGSGEFDIAVTTPLSEGQNEITATAEESGKTESDHSSPPLTVTVDTQPPTVSPPDMIEDIMHGGKYPDDDVVSDPSPEFQGTTDPDCDWVLYVDGDEEHQGTTTSGSWQWWINPVAEGSHVIGIKAIDAAGNESGTETLSILIDLTAPTSSHGIDGDQVTLSAVDTGGSGVSRTKYRINGESWLTYVDPFTISPDDTVEYYAKDIAGNKEQPYNSFGPTYTLTVGTVNGSWGEVHVEPDQSDYLPGTPVGLMAIPNDGKSFTHWQIFDPNYPGDANYAQLDANTSIAIVMDDDREVTAVFKCGSSMGPLLPMMLGALGLSVLLRRRG